MSEITQADRDAAVKAMDQMPHYERGLSFATLNRVLTEAFASHREAGIEEAAQKREHDPWADLTEIDGLVFKMLDELHANVPEAERPKSPSDLSRDQLKRARRAVVLVRLVAIEEAVKDEADVERVARAIAPECWQRRDEDASKREHFERNLSVAWKGTTFEQWVERSVQLSLIQARDAIRALAEAALRAPALTQTDYKPVTHFFEDEGAPAPEAKGMAEKLAMAERALQAIEPHLDAIVCYASTMGEHEPNRIAAEVRTALSAIRADAIARGDQT